MARKMRGMREIVNMLWHALSWREKAARSWHIIGRRRRAAFRGKVALLPEIAKMKHQCWHV